MDRYYENLPRPKNWVYLTVGQKGHNDLGFSPLPPLAPMATINGANGDPMAPMVMDVMAPMEHPIAIGTNGDHHW